MSLVTFPPRGYSMMLMMLMMLLILADFNLAVSTLTAKPPNLNPRQIFRLYGNADATTSLKYLLEGMCRTGSLQKLNVLPFTNL